MHLPIAKPALFSVWVIAHLIAFAFLLRFALVSVSSGGQLDYPSATDAFAQFFWLRGLPIPLGLWEVAALLMGVLLAIGVVLTYTFKTLLDWADMHSVYAGTSAAIVWGIKKLIASGLIVLCLFFPLGALSEAGLLAWLALISLLIIPILALNIASPHTASGWISPWIHWPNWQIILATFSIALLILAFDFLLEEIPFAHWLIELPVTLGAYAFIHLFAASVLLSIFIYRIPPKNIPREFKARANWRFVLAWLVLDIKILSLVVWVIPPLLLISAYMIYAVPVAVDIMNSLNQPRSMVFDVFISVIDAIAEYWWLAAPSFWALWLMVSAHFLVAYDNLENRAPTTFS